MFRENKYKYDEMMAKAKENNAKWEDWSISLMSSMADSIAAVADCMEDIIHITAEKIKSMKPEELARYAAAYEKQLGREEEEKARRQPATAEWIWHGDEEEPYCSRCKNAVSYQYPFCPWCGAKMKEGLED